VRPSHFLRKRDNTGVRVLDSVFVGGTKGGKMRNKESPAFIKIGTHWEPKPQNRKEKSWVPGGQCKTNGGTSDAETREGREKRENYKFNQRVYFCHRQRGTRGPQ